MFCALFWELFLQLFEGKLGFDGYVSFGYPPLLQKGALQLLSCKTI